MEEILENESAAKNEVVARSQEVEWYASDECEYYANKFMFVCSRLKGTELWESLIKDDPGIEAIMRNAGDRLKAYRAKIYRESVNAHSVYSSLKHDIEKIDNLLTKCGF
jgi:hypothetical protein